MLAEKGIRVNALAPGPIWTPLIPSTMPDDTVRNFGKQVPMKRPGQPAELATAYVMLADPMSSYVSGRRWPSPVAGRSSERFWVSNGGTEDISWSAAKLADGEYKSGSADKKPPG
jgi:NAD(P)-dependent dehydrogenase (short-subunit alcohol dehydrogenase family)